MADRYPVGILKDELGNPVGLREYPAGDTLPKSILPELNAPDVGLGNVNNTSDSAKPISVAQQAALDTKVDKIAGKGLSTEDFTTAEKGKLAELENFDDSAIQAQLSTKVDKVAGKALSTNDYTTAEKDKLSGIATGATANQTDAYLLNRENHTGTQPISTVEGLPEALAGREGTEVNVQTSTAYTLVLTDAFKMVAMDNSGANTLTVPPNSSVAFPANTRIDIGQDGEGQTTVVAGTGVVIRSPETLKLRKQWSKASLVRRAVNTWDLIGDLEQ